MTITSGPDDPTQDSTPTFTFVTDGAPTIIECRIDDGPFSDCQSPYTSIPLEDGQHRFEVRVQDGAGNAGSDTYDFTVDGAPPAVQITAGPTGPTNDATPTFEFFTTGDPSTTQCRIDSGPLTDCANSYTSPALDDGAHVFTVRVADAAGNEGSDERAFVVDTVDPVVQITSGPSGVTQEREPSFGFSVSGDPVLVECQLDGGAFAPCTSPFSVGPLSDGGHTVTVRAADAAGNTDEDSRSFTVDTVGPTVTITSGPTGVTNDDTPTFGFTVGGDATEIECRFGSSGPFSACSSPVTASPLPEGANTFTVRARDAVGNEGSDSRSFTIDTIAPTVTITGGPAGATRDTTPTFTFTTGGGATRTECRIGGGAFSACTSPYTSPALDDGSFTFQVRAFDAAGNSATASRSFSVDTTPPTVTITGGPTGPTNDRTPTFTFTTSGGATRTECRVGGGAFAACSSPYTSPALGDGSYTFQVRAFDAAGNSATASRSFSVDTDGPTVRILEGPQGLYPFDAGSFEFQVTGDATVVECRLTGGFEPCEARYVFDGLIDGAYTFVVRVRDAAGNTASESRSFTIDTTPPTVTITSGPSGVTGDTTPTFRFTTSGNAVRTECRILTVFGGQFVSCTSPFTTLLGNGSYTFTVRAFDAAGNSAAASRSFSINNRPDLVVSSATIVGRAVRRADGTIALPYSVTVRNQGGVSAPTSKVSVHYRGLPTAPTIEFVTGYDVPGQASSFYPFVPSLGPGASATLTGNIIFASFNEGASVTVRALADSCSGEEFVPPFCRVDESSESNNWSVTRSATLP